MQILYQRPVFLGLLCLLFSCKGANQSSAAKPPVAAEKKAPSSDSAATAGASSEKSSEEDLDPSQNKEASNNLKGSAASTESSLVGPPNPKGDPLQVLYHQEAKWLYLSEVQNSFTQPVDFSCPGDAILVGEKSSFDNKENTADRKYQFYCQFMTDGQGVGLRKTNCELSNIFKGEDIAYTCPAGKFMSGQKSWYRSDSKDREYQYECCELLTQSEKKIGVNFQESEEGASKELCSSDELKVPTQLKNIPNFAAMVNVDVNDRFEEVNYSCAGAAVLPLGGLSVNFEPLPLENAVLRRVKSHLNSDNHDRSHSFYCCQLKVE